MTFIETIVDLIKKVDDLNARLAMIEGRACDCACHQEHVEEKTITIDNAITIEGDVSEEVADKVTQAILKRIGRELVFGDVR